MPLHARLTEAPASWVQALAEVAAALAEAGGVSAPVARSTRRPSPARPAAATAGFPCRSRAAVASPSRAMAALPS